MKPTELKVGGCAVCAFEFRDGMPEQDRSIGRIGNAWLAGQCCGSAKRGANRRFAAVCAQNLEAGGVQIGANERTGGWRAAPRPIGKFREGCCKNRPKGFLHLEDVAFARDELIQHRADNASQEQARDQAGDDYNGERLL